MDVQFPNRLASERRSRGLSRAELAQMSGIDSRLYGEIEEGRMLPRFDEMERLLASLGGIEPMRVFDYSIVNTIGDRRFWTDKADYQRFYDSMNEAQRLLVSPEEMLWLDRDPAPDREVEVALNLSCSTQFVPHIMLDAVGIMRALGVSHIAGANRIFCCGTYYRRTGRLDGTMKMNAASVLRSLTWGARTMVHTCTQCVNTFTEVQRRARFENGDDQQGLEHVQLLRFLVERLDVLGDRVPWKKEVRTRILVHGHSSYSWVHDRAKLDVAEIAKRIPGVEVVGFLDRISLDSFCDSEPGVPRRERPRTRAETNAYREELAEIVGSRGADTVSPQHQTCLQMWEPFSSSRVDVRNILSILAEALGVEHPDRYKAASRLGDIRAIVEQTRPIWTAWGMSEDLATETARGMFDPAYALVDRCACGKSESQRCGHDELISVDVLTGRGVAASSS